MADGVFVIHYAYSLGTGFAAHSICSGSISINLPRLSERPENPGIFLRQAASTLFPMCERDCMIRCALSIAGRQHIILVIQELQKKSCTFDDHGDVLSTVAPQFIYKVYEGMYEENPVRQDNRVASSRGLELLLGRALDTAQVWAREFEIERIRAEKAKVVMGKVSAWVRGERHLPIICSDLAIIVRELHIILPDFMSGFRYMEDSGALVTEGDTNADKVKNWLESIKHLVVTYDREVKWKGKI